MTRTFMNMDYGLHLFHQSQQAFHSGHQGVGRLHNMFVVHGLLLLHRRQSLLSLAQGLLHLLQLPGQRFVTLLQLRFHLCVLVWEERRVRKLELFCCGEKCQLTKTNLDATTSKRFLHFLIVTEARRMCQYTFQQKSQKDNR